jgi:hypothetical protein
MLRVCHIVTRTTTKTTAPKNHSALLPISPELRTMNQTMATLPAKPQASQAIPRHLGLGHASAAHAELARSVVSAP